MNRITSMYRYFLMAWTAVVFVVFMAIINEKLKTTQEVSKNIVNAALKQDTMFRYWASSHGGVYVKATKKTPPNVNLAHLPNRDVITQDVNLTLMNPAYMLRQMMHSFEGLYGLKGHITSLKAFSPEYNEPDEWEKSILLELEKTKKTDLIYEIIKKDNEKYLRAFEPLVTKESCLKCHAIQGYNVGDIRGGVSMTLPLKELLDEQTQSIIRILIAFIGIYLIGIMIIRYFYQKTLQKIKKEEELIKELEKSKEMMMAQSRSAAMGEMLSLIAHQWRQPISTIAMGANTLLADVEFEKKVENAQVKDTSYLILDQTNHLAQTIDDFKNFFKPDKETQLVGINEVIDDTLKIIGKSLENNNIQLIKEYQSNTKINIYSRELLQVIINIIKNAKDALVHDKIMDGEIKVSTYEEGDYLFIKICDNGKGIEETIIQKVFDPYFTTKENQGTGLGLYMSKIIIEEHLSGRIECFNDNGACFVIRLNKSENLDG